MKYSLSLLSLICLNLHVHAMEERKANIIIKRRSSVSIGSLPKLPTNELREPTLETPGKRKSPSTENELKKDALPDPYRDRRYSDPGMSPRKLQDLYHEAVDKGSIAIDLKKINLRDLATLLSPRENTELSPRKTSDAVSPRKTTDTEKNG